MPPNYSPSQKFQFAGEILGTPLDEWVKAQRDAGKSWGDVSMDLAIATNGRVRYSNEHLRRLFSTAPEDGAA